MISAPPFVFGAISFVSFLLGAFFWNFLLTLEMRRLRKAARKTKTSNG